MGITYAMPHCGAVYLMLIQIPNGHQLEMAIRDLDLRLIKHEDYLFPQHILSMYLYVMKTLLFMLGK